MARISNLYWKAVVGAVLAVEAASAMAQLKLNDMGGTTGAGSNDLSALATKSGSTMQYFADLAVIVFAFIGVLIFGISVFGLYKAGKEDRESPKGAFVGLIVGAALTAVTLLLGLTRNTLGVS